MTKLQREIAQRFRISNGAYRCTRLCLAAAWLYGALAGIAGYVFFSWWLT